jgi:hypothetical protein
LVGLTGSLSATVTKLSGVFVRVFVPLHLGLRYKVTTNTGLLGKSYPTMIKGDQILSEINKYVPPPINFYQIILIDEGVVNETAKTYGYVKEVIKHNRLGDYTIIAACWQVDLFKPLQEAHYTNAISGSLYLIKQ